MVSLALRKRNELGRQKLSQSLQDLWWRGGQLREHTREGAPRSDAACAGPDTASTRLPTRPEERAPWPRSSSSSRMPSPLSTRPSPAAWRRLRRPRAWRRSSPGRA
jgi:hypothetical protein